MFGTPGRKDGCYERNQSDDYNNNYNHMVRIYPK